MHACCILLVFFTFTCRAQLPTFESSKDSQRRGPSPELLKNNSETLFDDEAEVSTRISPSCDKSLSFSDPTSLHVAAEKGDYETLCTLIEGGADCSAEDTFGSTALHRAAAGGDVRCLNLLLRVAENLIEIQNCFLETPLHLAAANGHPLCVRTLLVQNASTQIHNNSRKTPLHYAAEQGHADCVKMLLQNAATTTYGIVSPLHLASLYGQIGCMKLLIKHRFDSNARVYATGQTPLHFAAKGSSLEALTLLVKSRARVDVKDRQGYYPIWYANESGNAECISFLLGIKHTHYFDADARTYADRSESDDLRLRRVAVELLNDALNRGELAVVKTLVTCRVPVDGHEDVAEKPLFVAIKKGDLACLEILLLAGAQHQIQDDQGNTPVHYAVEYAPACCTALFNAGASPQTKNHQHETPVHRAAQKMDRETLNCLIQAGASVHVRDVQNRTPLALLVTAKQKRNDTAKLNRIECINILIRAGELLSVAPSFTGNTLELHQITDLNLYKECDYTSAEIKHMVDHLATAMNLDSGLIKEAMQEYITARLQRIALIRKKELCCRSLIK